ncbi:hypothetical protein AcV7_002770 [Taiwanofungus camphoratus]|nr:hypothetical protein AcV7_002770 [Antrodia cinnamomea]
MTSMCAPYQPRSSPTQINVVNDGSLKLATTVARALADAEMPFGSSRRPPTPCSRDVDMYTYCHPGLAFRPYCGQMIVYVQQLYTQRSLKLATTIALAVCTALAVAALRRNLTAHAMVDVEIVVGGSRAKMVEQLERILPLRAANMTVRKLL